MPSMTGIIMSLIIMSGTSSNALLKPSCPFELIVYIFGERIVQSGIFYGKYGLVMFESYFLLETYLLFQHTSGIYGYRLAEQFEASETHCGKRNAGEWTSPFHRRYFVCPDRNGAAPEHKWLSRARACRPAVK